MNLVILDEGKGREGKGREKEDIVGIWPKHDV